MGYNDPSINVWSGLFVYGIMLVPVAIVAFVIYTIYKRRKK